MLGDTILAQATADGAGERAIVRLSGPAARAVAAAVFAPALPEQRGQAEGTLRVRDRDVPAFALVMPGPRSFTGEDVVELHLPGSPLLVAGLRDDLLARGAAAGVRLAQPGEFTARACANGRLDLAQAEGLLMVLHAADRRALATSAQWLRGGMSEALAALRERLGDALALLESGLDFEAGETGTVAESEVEALLAPARVRIAELRAALPAAAPGGEVLLLGAANAGKSSLCNALARRAGTATRELLVDAVAGTTRDLVRVPLGAAGEEASGDGAGVHGVGEHGVALWDAPGDLDEPAAWDAAALQLRDRLAGRAAAALAVIDATAPRWPATGGATDLPWLAVVITKADARDEEPAVIERAVLAALPAAVRAIAADLPRITTSATTGLGLEPLLGLLQRSARAATTDAGAPLRAQLQAAAGALERAADALALGPELAAVELQAALAALAVDGRGHSAEPVLDRIYGRFCLGK